MSAIVRTRNTSANLEFLETTMIKTLETTMTKTLKAVIFASLSIVMANSIAEADVEDCYYYSVMTHLPNGFGSRVTTITPVHEFRMETNGVSLNDFGRVQLNQRLSNQLYERLFGEHTNSSYQSNKINWTLACTKDGPPRHAQDVSWIGGKPSPMLAKDVPGVEVYGDKNTLKEYVSALRTEFLNYVGSSSPEFFVQIKHLDGLQFQFTDRDNFQFSDIPLSGF